MSITTRECSMRHTSWVSIRLSDELLRQGAYEVGDIELSLRDNQSSFVHRADTLR